MSKESKKSNMKQWIMLILSLCFLAGALKYRQVKIESLNTISVNYGENVTAQQVFNDEVKVMNELAAEFDKINETRDVEKHGQPVMDIVSKWAKIKEIKGSFSAEVRNAEIAKNKEDIKTALTRLQNASLPIQLYQNGQSLMAQVGDALGARISPVQKAKDMAKAEAAEKAKAMTNAETVEKATP